MFPGGIDLVLEGPTDPEDWWFFLFEVRQRWPDSIFHRVSDSEMFAYRDLEAFQGGVKDDVPGGEFLHLLLFPESLTIVTGDEKSSSAAVGRHVFTKFQKLRKGYKS